MEEEKVAIIKKIIWLRLAQIIINERYKNGDFSIPIHLALGHETLATAVDFSMTEHDNLLLSHRNMHYNLARMGSLNEELNEYYLLKNGLAHGHLGSMNLSNPEKGISYCSSILGNNLPVGCGFALANKVKEHNGMVFIVTGDGAIEEGSFYESLLFLKSNQLSSIIIVENNEWSLATKIEERRAEIDLAKIAESLNVKYSVLKGNDPIEYKKTITSLREQTIENKSPILLEVKLTTLGYWKMPHEDFPDGKFINYHGGPAPEVSEKEYPLLDLTNKDPLFPLEKYLPKKELLKIAKEMAAQLKSEIS